MDRTSFNFKLLKDTKIDLTNEDIFLNRKTTCISVSVLLRIYEKKYTHIYIHRSLFEGIGSCDSMDLPEAEDPKKRWQEHKEEQYKKGLNDPDNHDGVITHLEPDILEYEVKWALQSITMNKASGGDGIPAELFQS